MVLNVVFAVAAIVLLAIAGMLVGMPLVVGAAALAGVVGVWALIVRAGPVGSLTGTEWLLLIVAGAAAGIFVVAVAALWNGGWWIIAGVVDEWTVHRGGDAASLLQLPVIP